MVPDPPRPSRFPGAPDLAGISSHRRDALIGAWTLLRVPPGSVLTPAGLDDGAPGRVAAIVPGTVAAAERALGILPALERTEDYDASDWWYRCRFQARAPAPNEEAWLGFEGLATLAEVWLNGERVGMSDNMFRALELPVGPLLRAENVLDIRFRSLRAELERRRPRPGWRTGLVEHQQLRWFRTTLLGRMPGWSPPVRPVGPWRPVWLDFRRAVSIVEGDALPQLVAGRGQVAADFTVRLVGGSSVQAATLEVGGASHALSVEAAGTDAVRIQGDCPVPAVQPWWPHTHGDQPRYPASLRLATSAGTVTIDLGRMAFRSVRVDQEGGGFRLIVNDVPIFCRGACWSNCDIVALRGTDAQLDRTLGLVRDAHMNMLRVGGTMVYEDRRFHDRCDELGIMVWQDFMYANMDYPAADEAFLAEAVAEASAVLAERRRYASTVLWCGGSEVEQQAAMLGQPRDRWTNRLFSEVLPGLCDTVGSGVAYVRNSPTGGPLPFSVNAGVSHYYGVGAYLRPLEDARRSGVRFTSETLGFANVPEPVTLETLLRPGEIPPHHPRWKARVPRDTGAGWDFDDIRDHYLQVLFGVEPARLRYADVERYLALSRVVTGEVMARTFGEWRSGGTCWGGLVWFCQDLWTGAGWGVIDALGRPKAAWHYLKRAFAPVTVFLTNEGLNGIDLHVINDTNRPLDAEVRLTVYRDGGVPVAEAAQAVQTGARARLRLSGDELLGHFIDLTGAYRFGPPGHDLVAVELLDRASRAPLGQDVLLPHGLPGDTSQHPGLSGRVIRLGDDDAEIELASERLALGVSIDAGRWQPLDNFVHLLPSGRATMRLRGLRAERPATVEAVSLNGGRCRMRLADTTGGAA